MRSLRVLVTLLIAIAVTVGPGGPASAHAGLLGAVPAPGSIIGTSPTEVTVTFSEAVTPVPGRVQVLDPAGERISGTATATGGVLRIPIRRAGQPLGTYLVSYRVISADSHPVGGAVTFSVGAPSARPPEAAESTGQHRSVTVATPVTRLLGYAGLTLACGPALFLALLWPRRRDRCGAVRLVYAGLAMIGVSTVGSVWLQAPASTGSALWDVSPAELGQVLATPYGLTLLARLTVLAALAFLLPPLLRGRSSRGRKVLVLALALGGMATWPLTGHAVATPLSGAIVVADVAHIAAMSVWLGGLVTLAVFLLRRTDPRVLGVLLPAWSRWAATAVVWLVAGGVVQAVVHVGSVRALWQNDYGRLLLAKVTILAVTLAVAAYARRLVHRAHLPAGGVARMRRTVGIEVAATTLILGLSAVLVQLNPAGSAAAQQSEVRDNGVSQTLSCPLYTLQFNIFPVEVGDNNTIHAFVYTPSGAPQPAEEWTVSARLLGQNIEPVSTPLLPLVPRHHAAGAITFPLAGDYEVTFTIRIGDIDQATVRTTITVPAAATR